MPPWARPRKLAGTDPVRDFDCGDALLNRWLRTHALTNQQAGMATTFVCLDDPGSGRVLAFYALAAGGIGHRAAATRIRAGVPRHDIPVIVLARLAVTSNMQGAGLGRAMLRDALIRVEQAADIVGIRCLLVHAKDEAARDFYLRCAEFEQSPTDPMNLQLLMKDLRANLRR